MSTPDHSHSDPALWDRVQRSFDRQGLMAHWGARLLKVRSGQVEIELPYSDRITQQQGGFHGGAIGALADITAGYAALTVASPELEVTTIEYKINFLAAFQGGTLLARGEVVRAGRRVIVAGARVVHIGEQGAESDCALMQATFAPIPKTY
ncbi:MAG: hypothetical protein RL657_2906 [Pseudomonadota bacterium]|jgi:uncharacterized protein (TIGR00369 family)